ncbi:MAG: MATE family efflux transporter [Eubacterium sp.]|nr:MATE family efflux transporter [Eubacterium sp.]
MKHTSMSQFDIMTTTPVNRLVLRLAVPTTLSMLITNIYNLADTAFVGMLGTSQSAAVGVVFGFMSVLQAIGFMFGQGSGSILSRLLGAKKEKEASKTASTAFFLSLGIGILIGVFGTIFHEPLINLLGSTDTIAPYARIYLYYILLGTPFIVTSFVLNNILRYEGKAALAMIGIITGGVLNIGLDPLFMFVFKMGIAGAGLATCLSQIISFLLLLSVFLLKKTQTRLSVRNIDFSLRQIGNICSTGLPSMLRQGLTSVATIILNEQAAVFGDAAVAAFSIVSRIIFFVISLGLGIGQGFQPVSAFNYGAGRYSRVRGAYRFTAILSQCVISLAMFFVILFAGNLIGLFRNDPDVIQIGTRSLYLQCFAGLALPVCIVSEMLLQSTGQRLAASVVSALRSGVFFIPAVLILPRIRGLAGLQEAQPAAFLLSFLPSILMAVRFFKKLPKETVPETDPPGSKSGSV